MTPTNQLRRQVEDLALRLVVEDPESSDSAIAESWMPALRQIRDEAASQGAPAVAEAARGIMDGFSAGVAGDLQQGILRLQQALESAGTEVSSPPTQPDSLAQDPELLSDFVLESTEHLARIETQLLALERDPGDSEARRQSQPDRKNFLQSRQFRGLYFYRGPADSDYQVHDHDHEGYRHESGISVETRQRFARPESAG